MNVAIGKHGESCELRWADYAWRRIHHCIEHALMGRRL
jgi:hypothetical protein